MITEDTGVKVITKQGVLDNSPRNGSKIRPITKNHHFYHPELLLMTMMTVKETQWFEKHGIKPKMGRTLVLSGDKETVHFENWVEFDEARYATLYRCTFGGK